MNKLKKLLIDPPTHWWEQQPDPETKEWTFNYYCESYMRVGETVDAAMERQSYRVVATHKIDGRTRSATSKTSFSKAYHTVLTMIMGEEC